MRMKQLFFTVIFFCLMYVPVFAMEKNVWTCSASCEIHFEIADEALEDYDISAEELTIPLDEETTPVEEWISHVEENIEIEDEKQEELIDDEDSVDMDEPDVISGGNQVGDELRASVDEMDIIVQDEKQLIEEPDEGLANGNN